MWVYVKNKKVHTLNEMSLPAKTSYELSFLIADMNSGFKTQIYIFCLFSGTTLYAY